MDRVPHGQQHADAQARDNGPYGFLNDQDDHSDSFFLQPSTTNAYNAWGPQASTTSGATAGNGSGDLVHGSSNAWQQTVHSTNPIHSQPVSHFDHPFSGAYGGGYGNHSLPGNPYGYQPGPPNFDSFNLDLPNDGSYGGLADINSGPYGQMSDFPDVAPPTQTISPSALHNPLSPYGQYGDDDDPHGDTTNSFSTDLNLFQTPAIYHGSTNANTYAPSPSSSNVRLPQGVRQGNFWVPDLKKLATVTNSKRLRGYLFVSDDTVPSVEKGKLTDILKKRSGIDRDGKSMRPSRNECLARVKSQQGNRAFSNVQKVFFKTLSSQTSASIKPNERLSIASQSPPEPESSEESEESSGPSDSEAEEDAEHSPLPPARPTDPVEAAEYDAIKVVWAPSNAAPGAEAIRAALRDHWKILQPIVGGWRKAKDGLKEPAAQKSMAERWKAQADRYRKILERILGATVKHGHRDIVGFFGENKQLFVLFYQLLVDRYVAGDCDNKLVQDIFSLLAKYNSIDPATWESAKLDKVVPKIEKKAKTDEVKSLAKQVLQLVVNFKEKESTRKAEDGVALKVEGIPGLSSGVRQKGEPTSLRKVASRDGVPSTLGISKKSEVKVKKPGDASGVKTSAIASKSGASIKASTVKPGSVTNTNAVNNATTNTAVKIKANPVTAKPTSFFSSLQSASKKPGTSNAAKSLQQNSSKTSDPKDGLAFGASEAKAAPKFSFAETLANIAKPKETPSSEQPSKPEIIETPEEKAKRLRKEERRKLHVHFKPDEELVEIRMLTHDPEEDLGHDDTLTRDAHDLRGEARSFKMHRDQSERLDDDDEGMIAGAAAAANENTSLNAQSSRFDDKRNSDSEAESIRSSQSGQAQRHSALDSVMRMLRDPNSSIRGLFAAQSSVQQPYQPQAPQPNLSQTYQPAPFPPSQGQAPPAPQAQPPRTGYDLYYPPREEWWKLAGSLGKIDSREKLEQLFALHPQKPPEQAPAPPPPASMQSQQFQHSIPQASNLPPNMQALLATLSNPSASQAPATTGFPNLTGYPNVNQQQLASAIPGLNIAQLQSLFGAAANPQQAPLPNPTPFPPQFQSSFAQAQAPQATGLDVQALLNQLARSQAANPQQPAGFPPMNFGFQGGQPGANMQQPPPPPNYGYNYQGNQQQQQSQGSNTQGPNYDNQQGGRHYKRKRDGDDVNDFHEGKNSRGDRKKAWRNNPHR